MDGLKLRRPRLSSPCHRALTQMLQVGQLAADTVEISINQQVFRAEAAPPGAKGAERVDAPAEGPRPKVGKL